MIISTQLDPIDRDIELIVSEELSPQAQNKALIEFAHQQIDLAVEKDESVLGYAPSYVTLIDGVISALKLLQLNNTLTVEFDLVEDVLTWIAEELRRMSPVRTGRYQASHKLYADGREVDPGHVPAASEYVFISELPYAHKIETGESQLAPKGVYELVAGKAAQRFGNIARIRFSYRAPFAGGLMGGRFGNRIENRRPAIIITLR